MRGLIASPGVALTFAAVCIGGGVSSAPPLHAQAAQAPSALSSEWHGVLTTPQGPLTLLFRIRTAADSTRSGDLESISQAPGQLIPLGRIALTPSTLSFTIPAIGANYEGIWNANSDSWTGTFRQGMSLPLVLKRGAPPALPTVTGLDGTWRGILLRDSTRLRLILYVTTSAQGTEAKLDSPDLGAMGLAVQGFERSGDTIRFAVPAGQARFTGTFHAQSRTVTGNWTRGTLAPVPVTFTRDSSKTAARERTQWPIVAKGYRSTDVEFPNAKDTRVTLSGTLTIPVGRGPFPAAILISGSGAQDRDETIFGHKPFAVLADHLTRAGIAVLRYDDRGVAGSTGDFSSATSADFATDATAAIEYLRTRPEISRRAIGFIGHSEGGMIGPMAAAKDSRVKFLVLLAGPGTATKQLMLSQRMLMGAAEGVPEAQLSRGQATVDTLLETAGSTRDSAHATTQLRAFFTDDRLSALGATPAQRDVLLAQYTSPWMRYFLRYNPGAVLSRVRVPVLALNGTLDTQVPSAENLAAIRSALAGNRDVTTRELPGLNHLFQHARTGALSEYEGIAETFSPEAMGIVGEWINVRFGGRRVR